MHFTQSATATDECDRASHGDRRKDLEECPGPIVQEEDPFDREKRAEEDTVGNRGCLQGFGEVANVGAEE